MSVIALSTKYGTRGRMPSKPCRDVTTSMPIEINARVQNMALNKDEINIPTSVSAFANKDQPRSIEAPGRSFEIPGMRPRPVNIVTASIIAPRPIH